MKIVINRLIKLSSLFIVFSLVLVNTSFAAANPNVDASNSQFCKKLPTVASNIKSNINSRSTNATNSLSNRENRWTNIWTNVDSKVSTNRSKADTLRQQHFDKLLAKAKTSTQQQAVKQYITDVNNAVAIRRTAYDNSRNEFRNALNNLISSKSSSVSSQVNEFSDQVNSAINTATDQCANNSMKAIDIRSNFTSSLKSIRQQYETNRKSDAGISSQIKSLVTTRNNEFKAADLTFKTSIDSARANLVKAFGQNANSSIE